jgi:peroxiredoxin Q/BCP
MPIELGQAIPSFSADFPAGRFESTGLNTVWVLYFYPKDNTPGCTTESAAFRDAYPAFQAAGATVLGISRDSLASHRSFKAKLALPFELISDPDETVCNVFDVIKLKSIYGKQVRGIERSTFVIHRDQTLARAWRGVKVPGHVDEVLQYVRSL